MQTVSSQTQPWIGKGLHRCMVRPPSAPSMLLLQASSTAPTCLRILPTYMAMCINDIAAVWFAPQASCFVQHGSIWSQANRLTALCRLPNCLGVTMSAVVKVGFKPATCCAGSPIHNLSDYAADISLDPLDKTLYLLRDKSGQLLLSDPQNGIGRLDGWIEKSVAPFFGRSKLGTEGVAPRPTPMEGPRALFVNGLVKVSIHLHHLKTARIQCLTGSVLDTSGKSVW